MIYLIIGNKDLIDEEIKEIISKNEINKNSIARYDLEESSVENAIIDIQTISLFQDKKLVITNNSNLIDKSKMLEEYLEKPNENILVLATTKSLDKRKKICKLIFEKATIINEETVDLFNYAKNELYSYEISNMDINLIINDCNGNKNRIKNELEKLKMYKYEEKNIIREDIKNIVKVDSNTNVFKLIEYINKKNKHKINETFTELISSGESEIKLLATLASNFRLVLQIKKLSQTKTDQEIIDIYKMKPFRLQKLKEQAYIYSEKELISFLKFFGKIDYNIKNFIMDENNFLNEIIGFI